MSFADLVLQGGPILTMVDGRIADAVAVKDGLIIAVGSKPEVIRLIGPSTVLVELDGRSVTPGLINSHDHMLEHGISMEHIVDIRYPKAKSIAEIVDIIGKRVQKLGPGVWIRAQNWDEAVLEELRYPTKHDLDPVSPENPVWTRRVFQMCTINSRALELAGITRDTPDPEHGYIQKDENGEPTGVLQGTAMGLLTRCIPEWTGEELEAAVVRGCNDFNEVGFTTVIEPGLMEDWINVYRRVYRGDKLTIRTYIQVGFLQTREKVKWALNNYSVGGDDMLRIIGLKMALDGGVGPRTALFYEPYLDRPNVTGDQLIKTEELMEMVEMGHRAGFQIGIHAIGDKAVDLTLDAYDAAQKAYSRLDPRHQLIHADFPSDEANRRLSKLGVVVNTQTAFLYFLGDSYLEAKTAELCETCMPIKTWQSNGVAVGTSHDATVSLPLPNIGMYGAVARKTIQGKVLGTKEAVTAYNALKMYTCDAAIHCFMEDKLGTVEVGKIADLAVWNFSPIEVDAEKLKDWKCQMTFLQGTKIYDANV